ncbi:hypothetical protein [Clostridium manihotivorum]|uniref:hypothetical protein n=1 Tax=Clostridium manihotivorum TaxID=2320868 RepID=UPI001EE5885C|nr:hypothetical protein [Clostridium manihotivorum]
MAQINTPPTTTGADKTVATTSTAATQSFYEENKYKRTVTTIISHVHMVIQTISKHVRR